MHKTFLSIAALFTIYESISDATTDPNYDVDERTVIGAYSIDREHNFILDASASPITIAEIGEELSYADAMDEAVRLATAAGAYGFFYQQHTNTYQIVGLYDTERDM